MKIIRRLIAVLLTLALGAALCVSAFAAMENFSLSGEYEAGRFTDVDETKWYGYYKQGSVATAYELGLMSGNSATTFNPQGDLKLSEAVTVAARIRAVYEGDEDAFPKTSPWYKTYVDYAVEKGIIPEDFITGKETAAAMRCEMAYIFAHALPEEEYEKLNDVAILPDVDSTTIYAEEILKLYNAGILTGNDKYGTFRTTDSIKRSEASALICRIAVPDMRLEFELAPFESVEPDPEPIDEPEPVPDPEPEPEPEKPGQWLENYTNEEVLSYFMSVAYQSEYGGARDHNARWTSPIKYSVSGSPQEGDLETLKTLTDRLNEIEGFPGISEAENESEVNMEIYFVSMNDFSKYVSSARGNFWGYANIWWTNDENGNNGKITDTVVLLADEIPTRLERDSIIYEEVLQSLGLLQDTYDYYESVFYQDSNYQGEPAPIDWALVEILYSPRMITGASSAEGRALAEQIIAEKSANSLNNGE